MMIIMGNGYNVFKRFKKGDWNLDLENHKYERIKSKKEKRINVNRIKHGF